MKRSTIAAVIALAGLVPLIVQGNAWGRTDELELRVGALERSVKPPDPAAWTRQDVGKLLDAIRGLGLKVTPIALAKMLADEDADLLGAAHSRCVSLALRAREELVLQHPKRAAALAAEAVFLFDRVALAVGAEKFSR